MNDRVITNDRSFAAALKHRWHLGYLRFKYLKKRLYSYLPYVRRKRYRAASAQLAALHRTLLGLNDAFAYRAEYRELVPLRRERVAELCLFVSFAAQPQLKPHVIDHIDALLAQGIKVVLIVNTDLPPERFQFPDHFAASLQGLLVRQNLGFDFAAWAHALSLLQPHDACDRLYFVNDSIVGPLNMDAFKAVVAQVRGSRADIVGLTESRLPCYHLQSFFLAFNKRLVSSPVFANFAHSVLNLPTKKMVIDCYETQLTQHLRDAGFTCEALFPNQTPATGFNDETMPHWRSLVDRGFPYIKARVLQEAKDKDVAMRMVPERYWRAL